MSDTLMEVDVEVAQEEEEIPILFLHGVERTYRQGDATLHILNSAELAIWAGQSVALVAPSGAGKSTLLHIAGPARTSRPRRRLYRRPGDRGLARRRTHPHPPQRDRLRLSVAPSAAGIHRARERAAAADDPRPVARRGQAPRGRTAGLSRPARPAQSPPGGIVRRRAAARGDCARRRQCAADICSPTSRPEISTSTPPTTCSPLRLSWCARRAWPPSSPPTTWSSPPAWTGA